MLVFSKAINGEGGPYDDVVVYWVTTGFTTQREKGPEGPCRRTPRFLRTSEKQTVIIRADTDRVPQLNHPG